MKQTTKLNQDFDPTAPNVVPVKVTNPGDIGGGGGYEVVGIKDSSDTRIDPATETTLVSIANIDFATETSMAGLQTSLDDLNAKDFSTETTLANVDSTLSSMDLTVNDINTAIGEVSATPTTNTVLDRLKAIGSDTTAIKTAVELIDNAISGNEMQVDVVASLPAGTNAIGKLAANSGVDIGDVDVTSISAGSNLIGDVGIQPRTSGGLSIFRSIDLDETEEDVKTSAGQVFGYYIYNNAAATTYVKFYNATAANVIVGTTTPVLTIPIPAGSAANVISPIGIQFDTAICVAATTGVADNNTGAPAANDLIINIYYK